MMTTSISRTSMRGLLLVALVTLVGCDSGPTEISAELAGSGTVPIHLAINIGGTEIAGVVVEVTGPGIGTPPPAANLTVIADGTAQGEIVVPAGKDRVFAIRAFDAAGIETHAGVSTADVKKNQDMTVTVKLAPVSGGVPVMAIFTTYSVTMEPATGAFVAVGGSLQLTATVRGVDGEVIENPALGWASLNPGYATVSASGLVTGLHVGTTSVVVNYNGVAAAAMIEVRPADAPAPLPTEYNGSWTVSPAFSTQCTFRVVGLPAVNQNLVFGMVRTEQVEQDVLRFTVRLGTNGLLDYTDDVPIDLPFDYSAAAFGQNERYVFPPTADITGSILITGTFQGVNTFTATLDFDITGFSLNGVTGSCERSMVSFVGTRVPG